MLKPFTEQEREAIIEAFRFNRFISNYSTFKRSHYTDFTEFLFLTGYRPSEAIGLQRKHIDFERGEVVICSVLARSDSGLSNGGARIRKETKTGTWHILPMTQ